DADSTCWGTRLAHAVGQGASAPAARAAAALAEHQCPGGGFATYHTDGPIRAMIRAGPEVSFRGWCGAHGCVTAAVAGVPERAADACRHLRATQRADGSWDGYWWSEPEYATALAAEALARAAAPGDTERVARAATWAMGRQHPAGFVATDDLPAGSPFATALCLRVLWAAEDGEAVERAVAAAVAWLWFSQRGDGGWRASARLRVPWPHDDRPEQFRDWVRGGLGEGALIVDQNAAFTTATVLGALGRLIAAAEPAAGETAP
ncbi:MAG TPA: prenyltransferase/squalene oxidase repeat-containing protein, partial [Longimicrobium sp.]|nr:prenyltransferase/squalene oxidase repeat-containing protein [Longimicrobium sp.]